MKPSVIAFAALLFSAHVANAATVIDLGTPGNSADWLITGGGAVDAASFQTNVNRTGAISITSNARRTGTFVTGATLAQFDGFWQATNSFFLPANATNVSLDFSGLYANDRGILRLNGVNVGNVDHLGATGLGVLRDSLSGTDDPFTFTGQTSGTVTSGFLIGQTNTLDLIVNNTGEISISAPTATFDSDGDGTTAFVNASVTFTAVPEPSTGILALGIAICGFAVRQGRVRRKQG